jgi:hypothetical protein
MLSAGEGWGEGNKPYPLGLDDFPLPNPLPRSAPTITRGPLAGEGTDRAAFERQLLAHTPLGQG